MKNQFTILIMMVLSITMFNSKESTAQSDTSNLVVKGKILNDHVVDVNYQIFIKDTQKKLIEDFKETHKMRYLFDNEIDRFLSDNGFNLISCEEWLTGKKPTKDSWGVTFICKKCD